MSLTTAQVNEAFTALGQPAPSAALLASLLAIPNNYDALNAIIALPQVQSADIPVVSMFDLALGHDPTAATLSSMVSGGASLSATASAFVASQSFANVYNAGVLLNPNTIVTSANDSIITALFINGLGHSPSPSTLAGFHGLTLAQAFLDFTTSSTVAVSAAVNASILQILELATGIPASVTPPPTQSFTLTNGGDSVISGAATIGTTTPGVTVQSSGNVTVNAPLTGPFGNQASLSPSDTIKLAGLGNSLNATFNGSALLTGMTIQGAQAWNIQSVAVPFSTVLIAGSPGAIDGVTSLTYNGGGLVNSLIVGAPGHGIDATTPASGFSLTAQNALGAGGAGVTVLFTAGSFAGGDIINVTANGVGNTLGRHRPQLRWCVPNLSRIWRRQRFRHLECGVDECQCAQRHRSGCAWLDGCQDAQHHGQTVRPRWIWAAAGGGDWAGLTTINASATTGNLTITGGENGPNGLLSGDTTALKPSSRQWSGYCSICRLIGGSVAGLSIFGGANTTIELSNTEINLVSAAGAAAFQNWSSVAVLDDVGVTGASDVGGAVNMGEFPGTNVFTLLSDISGTTGIHQTADFHVTNAQNNFVFNFNDTNQGGKNFEVDAVLGVAAAAGGTVTVNYGNGTNAFAAGSTGNFTSIGFDNVNLNVNGISDGNFYTAGIIAEASLTGSEVLTITSSVFLDIADATITPGVSTISLLGGTLLNPTSGELVVNSGNGSLEHIGVTNANVIMSNTTLQMLGPDNDITVTGALGAHPYSGVHVTANGTADELQGSLGTLTAVANPNTGEGVGATTHTGIVGNDVLTDVHGGSALINWFVGDGGADIINVANGNNEMFYGEDDVNHVFHALAITNTSDNAFQGFWAVGNRAGEGGIIGAGSSTSSDMTAINGFTMQGGSHDTLDFNADAWGGGGNGGSAGTGQLENGLGLEVNGGAAGDAVMQLVGAGTQVNGATTFALYTVGGLTNAADLASALSGIGSIQFGAAGHGAYDPGAHMLFAYASGGDIHIADVDFVNGLGAGFSTLGRTIVASDIYDIAGGNNGVTSSLAILGINNHDVHISFAA